MLTRLELRHHRHGRRAATCPRRSSARSRRAAGAPTSSSRRAACRSARPTSSSSCCDKLGEVLFWKIAMKPGRPLAYGRIGGAHFFGLPGNPVSVMVTFYQFVRDALLILQGQRDVAPLPMFKVPLAAPIRKVPGRTEFQRGDPGAGRRRRLDRAHDRRPGLGHPVVDVAGELLHRAAGGHRQLRRRRARRRAAARRADLTSRTGATAPRSSAAPAAPTRAEAFRYWLKLGFVSFGGPGGPDRDHASRPRRRRSAGSPSGASCTRSTTAWCCPDPRRSSSRPTSAGCCTGPGAAWSPARCSCCRRSSC